MSTICYDTGKECHETKDKALKHRARMRIIHNEKLSVYRCKACKGFHCGHPKNRNEARSA